MPGSRFEIFEGVGHFPQLERPREFSRLLRDFIETTEPAQVEAEDIRALLVDRALR